MWFIKPWMEVAKFNLEVQSVVSMRLMKIAGGGAMSRRVRETRRDRRRAVTHNELEFIGVAAFDGATLMGLWSCSMIWARRIARGGSDATVRNSVPCAVPWGAHAAGNGA
jgi:hypothetical protein